MSFSAAKRSDSATLGRFKSRIITVGDLRMGGNSPIVVQSMTTTDTMDVDGTVKQIIDLANVGCDLARITAPTIQDAEALRAISEKLRAQGVKIPLVADIHFVPAAAMVAADYVEKVRINPGNYADRKMFKTRDYTDAEYKEELDRIHEKFKPLVLKLKSLGRALRIGTNHGSLSDRIMNRFGDTPEGMVESAFEFADICRMYDFHNFCFSMKASNVGVMVKAYRLLVERQLQKNWDYPIHLGVTEAGFGEDGRMKSAIGIGTLLSEGIGDTIRVSLTEPSVKEVPVARALANGFPRDAEPMPQGFSTAEEASLAKGAAPAKRIPQVWWKWTNLDDIKSQLAATNLRPDVIYVEDASELLPEIHFLKLQLKTIMGNSPFEIAVKKDACWWDDEKARKKVSAVTDIVVDGTSVQIVDSIKTLKEMSDIRPETIILSWKSSGAELDQILGASLNLGSAFVDLNLRGLMIEDAPASEALKLGFGILQSTRRRMTKTEYISCPSCGRTLFDLEETTARIKAVTDHLKGVKIAVMGCIVNGPGEMADADFGYVGGAPGRVNLYVGKECVERNIPSEEAPARLVQLIKNNNAWVDPS